jgi:hypothetical protein
LKCLEKYIEIREEYERFNKGKNNRYICEVKLVLHFQERPVTRITQLHAPQKPSPKMLQLLDASLTFARKKIKVQRKKYCL